MVRPQDSPNTASDIAPGVVRDRGFIEEAVVQPVPTVVQTPRKVLGRGRFPVYFWGSVIAGTLLVLSIFVLSYVLMLACHVGSTAGGYLSLGWGAAIWICVTSCIAFYFGGMLASSITPPVGDGWLKGATIWGLSIPLALIISAIVAGGTGLLAGLNSPHITAVTTPAVANTVQTTLPVAYGFVWTAFTTLIVGLIFAILGGGSPAMARGTTERNAVAR